MAQTTYKGMKVFASFDKTQCGLEIAISEKYFLTTEMENDALNTPVFLQGHVKVLEVADLHGDKDMSKLYNEIKDEKYFIILKSDYEF